LVFIEDVLVVSDVVAVWTNEILTFLVAGVALNKIGEAIDEDG
jgi:hypothetical protein